MEELILRAIMATMTVIFVTAALILRRIRLGHGPKMENFLFLKLIRNLFRAEKRTSQKRSSR